MDVTADTTRWTLVTYRVPQDPSRHRVALWRELKRAGAISLQQATWALPSRVATTDVIERVLALVDRAGGDAYVFSADPAGEAMGARLEELFVEAREDEWGEFVRECDKFDAEIDHEIQTRKFTAAELDEEEQNLERLRRWFRELRARDVLGAPTAAVAEVRLKASAERLDAFAEQVFEAGGGR
ncbi:MAG: Chromate resistance protein ChrB [Planctomycetaceae bacterium]